MKNKSKIRFLYIVTWLFAMFVLLFSMKPIKVNATSSGYPISISALTFDDHKGMYAKINVNGQWYYIYCIQRGYPFRSAVSDLQMVTATISNAWNHEYYGTIASNIRYMLMATDGSTLYYFTGWGQWEMNGDLTNAYQVGTDGAPSSKAWEEAFTEFGDDDEDDSYNNRYQGTGDVKKWIAEVRPHLTGHEGSVEPQATRMKQITYEQAGLDMSQVYAMAMTNYYIWEDPDTIGYSETAKYQVKQACDWATEFRFIKTMGIYASQLRLTYNDSMASWRTGNYSGSCDGFIQYHIGHQYEAMKLYRQVVWKTTNMRQIPSFASDNSNTCEPIKLYWDANQNAYTATVADANGVLKYFDFEIPGVTCTDNGDGTLTIKSTNIINGNLTSLQKASKLEPLDGVFKMPNYYRWNLEGTQVTFKYTALVPNISGNGTYETEETRATGIAPQMGGVYEHSHDYDPGCNWYCKNSRLDTDEANLTNCKGLDNINHCTENPNAGYVDGHNTYHEHNEACGSAFLGYPDCNGQNNAGWVGPHFTRHEHTAECHTHDDTCYHKYTCPYEKNRGSNRYWNGQPIPADDPNHCDVVWACGKQHFTAEEKTLTGTYIDWQDMNGVYAVGQKIIDPTYAYIKVTTVPHTFPAETDTEILLIADNDEWNDLTYTMPNGQTVKHASHVRVGEKFHLKYIYSYIGGSKGFRIETSVDNKTYYQYNYLSRMQSPQNAIAIYNLRTGIGLPEGSFLSSNLGVSSAKLVIDKTPITIRGIYTTPETPYPSGGYTYDSGANWNDSVYLDALTESQYDSGYSVKSAGDITSSNSSSMLTNFTVSKSNNQICAVWVYDTEPEVFTSALVYGTAYIQVGENRNYAKSYYNEAYSYGADKIWPYYLGEHNNVGGVGYFSYGQSGELIPSHTVYTQNNEYNTYAIRNKVWQADIDIKVSNFVQNTGAGITEHIYQGRGRSNHDLNYNLYYTIDVENPKATIYEDKQKVHDGISNSDTQTYNYNTTSDVYEFDVNNIISWGSTGASQTSASYGNTTVVDHIKTGRTYIQREIPTVLNTMTAGQKETMTFSIYPNHDRLVYEDYYSGVSISGGSTDRRVSVSAKSSYYPPNEKTASSDIYAAMNPTLSDMQPQNINGANNVPDEYHQNDNALQHPGYKTSFSIKLSNGQIKTVTDSNTKTYTQYDFEYNPSNRSNKVTFPSRRTSVMFFKYSKTDYSYNGNAVQSAVGEFNGTSKTQTESYYISQVLFKSNYTSKYKKELEAQGADYIEEFDVQGNLTDAWIDMVNQNKYAIVAAGQGFELKVTVKYENSLLTQYLARYFGSDDAKSDVLGASDRVNKKYADVPANSRQFCNISSLTGKDGRTAPYYKNTSRAYVSSYSTLDRLAVNLVTGANVFNDLYCFMSDNPNTVYSYSGIYGTPVIFDRSIKYSDDFAVTTITYTMRVSEQNGIASNMQNMKFYTNQLAPDKKSPGIVEGMYDVTSKGEHSLTIWTPVIAATPFDYPNTVQERYLGDAIELGYTIKTTGADDSIVHIVQ